MYRQYESPTALQDRLDNLIANKPQTSDIDVLVDWHNECEDIKERIRFAWADIEYEETEDIW